MKYGWILLMTLALGASGCATKKFVRARLDPISQRVQTLEQQNAEQAEDMDDLGTAVSRADERAITADRKAEDAAGQAQNAGSRADNAGRAAQDARSLAERGLSGLDAVGDRIDSLNDYVLTAETTVQFALESAALDETAQSQLDEVAESVTLNAPCVIEVRGFTDTSGSPAYNLALSERRANAVVRYLATKHDIPLRQIHKLGLGADSPAADNTTLDGRKTNRRVEVKVYLADENAITALVH